MSQVSSTQQQSTSRPCVQLLQQHYVTLQSTTSTTTNATAPAANDLLTHKVVVPQPVRKQHRTISNPVQTLSLKNFVDSYHNGTAAPKPTAQQAYVARAAQTAAA